MNVSEPHVEDRGRGIRLVWIVPIVAAIIGLTLLINHWREQGPTVTITFRSGEGLEVGKTLVKSRDVTIGRVSRIVLSTDRTHVEVTADLAKSATDLAVEGSRFWVVRPRIGVGWASGLDTLLSGVYIGVEGGNGTSRTRFTGLESPPTLDHPPEGKRIVLTTTDLGSLSTGAPVYFRHYRVGQVIDEGLDTNGVGQVVLFVEAPNDHFVTPATRFWNASGVDLSLDADGLKLRTQSAATVIAGGVAFDDKPDIGNSSDPAQTVDLHLYKDQETAMAPPDGVAYVIKMRFEKPMRGLSVGAPIEFVGVEIGSVTAIDVGYEPQTEHFPVFVTGKLYPARMGLAHTEMLKTGIKGTDDEFAAQVARFVAHGLRARPRSGNLLTGRLYLSLDFLPDAPKARMDTAARPVELPTVDANLDELQAGVAQVVKKINALPLQQIANHADQDLVALHATLDRVNGTVLPAATDTLNGLHGTLQRADRLLSDDSSFQTNITQTLDDIQRALGSIQALADYLDRHPESLLRGRAPAASPPHSTDDRRTEEK